MEHFTDWVNPLPTGWNGGRNGSGSQMGPRNRSRIGEVVYSFFQKPGVQIAAAQPADFLQTIMAAVRMAQMKPKN